MNKIWLSMAVASLAASAFAQSDSGTTLTGQVVGADGQPLEGVILSVTGASGSTLTDEKGEYTLTTLAKQGTLKVSIPDYYPCEFRLDSNVVPKVIVLVPTSERNFSGLVNRMDGSSQSRSRSAASQSTHFRKDFSDKAMADLSWQGVDPSLQIIQKGGMPGEGAYFNVRGIHSLNAENTPLIVINGVPFLGNLSVSDVINGYSRDALFGYNAHDIRSITVLKGSDAAMYGSLGSNGVILIQTEQATSDNLDTRISFQGSYGVAVAQPSIPLLDRDQFTDHMTAMGLTRYSTLASLQEDYPFLSSTPGYYSYLFDNSTDWNEQIQRNAFVSDNVLRIEGGDEVAKYNISFGYTRDNGVLEETNTNRYHTALNTNIMVSRQFDIFAGVNLAYVRSSLNSQGMREDINPLLAAAHMMPNLNVYQQLSDGQVMPGKYLKYDSWNVSSNPAYSYDQVSNPVALVKTVNCTDKIYDANINLGLNYRPNQHWTITGQLNLYYDYAEEYIFIPGVTDNAIVPQMYGNGKNSVSMGVIRQSSYFYNLNAAYQRTFDHIHEVSAFAGARLLTRNYEYDAATGYNTANDFYRTLTMTTDDWSIYGNNEESKWLSFYAHGDYTYNNLLRTSVGLSVDGSTASGLDASRFGWFPSASLTYMMANQGILPEAISHLNLSVEASMSGNSRFSSNYAKNYYTSNNLFNRGTIVRNGVPNTKLEWEKKRQIDLGFDLSMLRNKLNLRVNGYWADHYDLLLDANISAVYGSNSIYYANEGEIADRGVEVELRYNTIRTKDMDWVVYANAAWSQAEVKSLGGQQSLITNYSSYNGDDAQTRMKVGASPYEFFGYKTHGVYATTEEANASKLRNAYGNAYQAGDVIFEDRNGDFTINDADRTSLGSAAPDLSGSFGSSFRWRQWLLSADFTYSLGNEAYNATRRQMESMDKFYNQSTAVLNRWQYEGQQTTMPRAAYGDPSGNNFFSDRWVEDASYLKLKNLRLAYEFTKKQVRVANGTVWVGAENLCTFTHYLGADPEFAYSYGEGLRGFDYAKVASPRVFKVGVNLNF